MSGWMIGLTLAGAFLGAVGNGLSEMTYDWNGGTTKPGALKRFFKATAAGAVLGLGLGWLVTDNPSPGEVAIEDCRKNAPTGTTINITTDPDGKTVCSYSKPTQTITTAKP